MFKGSSILTIDALSLNGFNGRKIRLTNYSWGQGNRSSPWTCAHPHQHSLSLPSLETAQAAFASQQAK